VGKGVFGGDHHGEQALHGAELRGWQQIEKIVRVLTLLSKIHFHKVPSSIRIAEKLRKS
jgi:hypothetical protein